MISFRRTMGVGSALILVGGSPQTAAAADTPAQKIGGSWQGVLRNRSGDGSFNGLFRASTRRSVGVTATIHYPNGEVNACRGTGGISGRRVVLKLDCKDHAVIVFRGTMDRSYSRYSGQVWIYPPGRRAALRATFKLDKVEQPEGEGQPASR